MKTLATVLKIRCLRKQKQSKQTNKNTFPNNSKVVDNGEYLVTVLTMQAVGRTPVTEDRYQGGFSLTFQSQAINWQIYPNGFSSIQFTG